MEANFAPVSWFPSNYDQNYVSRAILLTNRSILPVEKEQITLLRLPALNGLDKAVWVVELGPSSMACPPGLFAVHLTCDKTIEAECDLEPAVELLFQCSKLGLQECSKDLGKPDVLWCLYFNQMDNSTSDFRLSTGCPTNVTLTAGPSGLIDFDGAVKQAKAAFLQLFPDEEFLPRAPDPEDIVIEDTEPTDQPIIAPTAEAEPNAEEAVRCPEVSTPVVTTGSDLSSQATCEELSDQSLPCSAMMKEE